MIRVRNASLRTPAKRRWPNYLPGWKLDHQILTSRYEYWDVSLGYGLTCDETQRQAIRTWIDSPGIEVLPVTQDR